MKNPKGEALTPGAYQAAIRERLHILRREHPQSELARRTHMPLTNVHRLMNTGKIPAEFCAALVDAFAVNPAWLLTGEGGALLSDVTAQSAQTGQGLLALVESMNAVSRMRLGALAGKQHQKVMRELSDAFGAYERLRAQLNAQSKPVFAALLEDLATHLRALSVERAQTASTAAQELSRLCDDEALHTRFLALQSDLEYLRGGLEKSLELSRRVFSQLLRTGALQSEEDARMALNLAMSLKETGRHKEALRTTIAALALARDHGRKWAAFWELELFRGHIEVELGMARPGLAHIQRVWPRLTIGTNEAATYATVVYQRALLLCGLITAQEARALGTPGPGTARQSLRWACWLEDESELAAACAACIGTGQGRLAADDYDAVRAALVLRALRGKAKLADFERGTSAGPFGLASTAVRDLVHAAHAAQFARLTGETGRAAKAVTRFETLRDAMPPDIYVNLDLLALHHHGVLKFAALAAPLATPARVTAARRFFRAKVRKGYGCFAPIVAAMPGPPVRAT
ncbi:MAG: hypothetical protein IT464_11505 [Planctomycetes bacterium]|nr:hypothetical protein [Planctomycetota bacterium]